MVTNGDWEQILARFGQKVLLRREDEEKEVRAFFQPVREKQPGMEPTPLGVALKGKYEYLGLAEETLQDVRELEWKGKQFRLLREREMTVGEKTGYRWGLFEEWDGG